MIKGLGQSPVLSFGRLRIKNIIKEKDAQSEEFIFIFIPGLRSFPN